MLRSQHDHLGQLPGHPHLHRCRFRRPSAPSQACHRCGSRSPRLSLLASRFHRLPKGRRAQGHLGVHRGQQGRQLWWLPPLRGRGGLHRDRRRRQHFLPRRAVRHHLLPSWLPSHQQGLRASSHQGQRSFLVYSSAAALQRQRRQASDPPASPAGRRTPNPGPTRIDVVSRFAYGCQLDASHVVSP